MKQVNENILKHLKNYPFNNVDILLGQGEILSLADHALEDKISHRKRGGYCFEHNKFFKEDLRKAGYESQYALGRVIYGNNDADNPKTHLVNIVTINDQKYLADVGFGPYNPSVLVPLNGVEVGAHNNTTYRVVLCERGYYRLELKKEEGFFSLYQFELNNYTEADLRLSNFYANTHPDSKFVNSFVISIFANDGVKFMSNDMFSHINNGVRVDEKIESAERLYLLLVEVFKISISAFEAKVLFEIIQKFVRGDK
ncbi:N-acetyltransferase [Bacteriovorax sp. BSW11_IV]|uniref:arylamine N-acetyltransferase family protein n=1 Tax=Bacteriovorax sp. BSW11_IV TaxID=1353529 RepID=UPI00038A4516|nr:arylamine N-acetyltransferase [Bacteriovorax sp. BSW11_IV]EQC48705.1 N-acetyltransferase [Bacteriovorax sp. BSW11_IV]